MTNILFPDFIVKRVYDIIEKGSIGKNIEQVNMFMLDVPVDIRKKDYLPLGRINEIDTTDTKYCSNIPLQQNSVVQIDIWGDIVFLNDVSKELDNLMIVNEYTRIDSGIDSDIDFDGTNRLYKRFLKKDILQVQ